MKFTRSIDRSFSVGPQPELLLVNRRGRTVIRGEDREGIQMSATLSVDADRQSEADERFDAYHLPIEQRGDRVEIGPLTLKEELQDEFEAKLGDTIRIIGLNIQIQSIWSTPRMDVELLVPRRCEVTAESRTGALSLEGVRCGAKLQGRTARIDVSEVEGDVEIETRTGNVEARSVRGNLSAHTRTGKVAVEDVTGDVILRSRTSTIRVARVGGLLQCSTRVGSIRVQESPGAFQLKTQTGRVEYAGLVANPGSIEARNGSIRLAVAPDSAFFVDALAKHGRVSSELDVREMQEPSEGAPTIRLRTDTGSIRIVPA